jgi:signal transduction histidine kinase
MKAVPVIAAVALLVLLLSWLSLRAINSNAEMYDRALSELDQFTMVEAALHRDVLAARAGLLRNYDPLVSEINALYACLTQLRNDGTVDASIGAAIDLLTAAIGRQEQTVENFKTDNALLQNSLAHFALVGSRSGTVDRPEPLASQVNTLVADMLLFTLDTSPAVMHQTEDQLDLVAGQAAASSDTDPLQALVAHGRLLIRLLPATDAILREFSASAERPDRDVLRAIIRTHQTKSRETARRYRLLLYVTSLLLVGLLIHFGLRLRARAHAIGRRAALEHVITNASMRFVSAQRDDTDAGVDQALAEIALCVGADRAYFLLRGETPLSHIWRRPGIDIVPGWPDRAIELAAQFGSSGGDVIHIVDVNRLQSGLKNHIVQTAGLRGWALVSSKSSQGQVFLGFDAVTHPCLVTQPDELGLLRLALDNIVNAVERRAADSQRIRLEERLQQTRRMETVGALASGVAHNFNNIIAAILGYVEIAETQQSPGGRYAQNLKEIRRAGERARDLVDQILAFGKRRDGRRGPISIRNVLAESASLLRVSLPSEISLVFGEIPQDAIVSAESVQIQQLILNLCNNAAQALDGTGRIEVETKLHKIDRSRMLSHGQLRAGSYVSIAVSDTGPGIDESVLKRIFEPFFTTRAMGNGLGLATVFEIVRDHGGAIDVVSSPGRGTRFEAWLARLSGEVLSSGSGHKEEPRIRFGRGETVLVLEADPEQLLRDEEIVAALGYEPVGFRDADDMMTLNREIANRFDAVLIGHLQPRIAVHLAAALNEIAPRVPIVLAADSAESIGADVLMASGISEVVNSPIVATEIAGALARCLRSWPQGPATTVTRSGHAEIVA